jgi:MFS transporter, MCT family, solute carrier family 16 (monocarboxylic acid transporters), member 3
VPTSITKLTGPGPAPVAMSMALTGWTVGYLMGSPIAGFIITSTGAEKSSSIEPYRATIFYAGGIAMVSATIVLLARLRMDKKMLKKL